MRSQKGFTMVEIMIVIMIIGILLTLAVPNFLKAKRSTNTRACVSNMQKIDCAKTEWAMEYNRMGDAVPDPNDLLGYLMPTMLPACPEGTDPYVMSAVDEKTVCPNVGSHPDHVRQ